MKRHVNVPTPIGLVFLCAGILLGNWPLGDASHFAASFLIGLSVLFVIAGFVKQSKAA